MLRPIDPRQILRARQRLERLGDERAMSELEKSEPDLAEQVLEGLTAIHGELIRLGAPAGEVRRVFRRIQRLVLLIAVVGKS